jgi:hypothetical protein
MIGDTVTPFIESHKHYSIGKELSAWVEKLFEVNIKPETIKTRAYRIQQCVGSNEPKESQPTETIIDSTPEIIKDRHPLQRRSIF